MAVDSIGRFYITDADKHERNSLQFITITNYRYVTNTCRITRLIDNAVT